MQPDKNFADDSTLYKLGKNKLVIVEKIIQACNRITDWFKLKTLSANPKKFQVRHLGKMINPINSLTIHNVDVKPKTTTKMRCYKQPFFSTSSKKCSHFPEADYTNRPYM